MTETRIGWFSNRHYLIPRSGELAGAADVALANEALRQVAERMRKSLMQGVPSAEFELGERKDGSEDEGGPLAHPYAVGGPHEGVYLSLNVIDCENAARCALWMLEKKVNLLSMGCDHPVIVGFWRDPNDETDVYFDAANLVRGRSMAEALAYERGQRTIFDLRCGEEMDLPDAAVGGADEGGFDRYMRLRHGLSVFAPRDEKDPGVRIGDAVVRVKGRTYDA